MKKDSKAISPAKKLALLVVVVVAALAATYFMITLPATDAASTAVANAETDEGQVAEAREELGKYDDPAAIRELAAQVAAADAVMPHLPSGTAEGTLALEVPRAIDNAATAAGGSFDGELDIAPIPMLGTPPTLRAARVTFTVTLTPEQYTQFTAALSQNNILLTTTSFAATAEGVLVRDDEDRQRPSDTPLSLTAPADFSVTGLVWWSTSPPANLGTLTG